MSKQKVIILECQLLVYSDRLDVHKHIYVVLALMTSKLVDTQRTQTRKLFRPQYAPAFCN